MTGTRREVFATVKFFRGLLARAARIPGRGRLFIRNCQGIDAGGILLLKYVGNLLGTMGWNPFISAKGEVMNLIKDNLDHYICPPNKRRFLQTKEGHYLLRGINSRSEMVRELEEWANTVRRGTSAPEEEVSLWQTEIAEVTTNSFQHAKTLGPGQILVAGRAMAGHVELAALDTGAGIPTVIAKTAPTLVNGLHDGDLIAHAFKKGVTSQCVAENQGAGLHTLARAVRQNLGGSPFEQRVLPGKREQADGGEHRPTQDRSVLGGHSHGGESELHTLRNLSSARPKG